MKQKNQTFSEVWWDAMPLQVLLGPNLDMQESMRILSENPVLDETFIRTHPEFQWNPVALSRKSGLCEITPRLLEVDWQHVASAPEIEWDMRQLSREAHVSVQDLKRFPFVGWNFEELSQNPSLTWAHIQAFPEKPWEYERLLRNPMPVWREAWLQDQAQMRGEGCRKRFRIWIHSWCYR